MQESTNMSIYKKWFFAAAVALLLSGCASAPNTFSNSDPSADFSQYKTFGYFAKLSTDNAQYQSLVSNFLKVAVAQEFDRRGLQHDAANPQLRVNFYINTQEKIQSRSVPTSGGYYGYRDPFYDPWGGYGGYGGSETRITQYTEGTLNIDVVDASTNKLVWEGSIVGRITDKDLKNLEKTVDEAVAAVMADFPLPPVGAQ
jgi:hypothetical protein